MEIKIVSTKENPLLKRKEVDFTVEQDALVQTPNRLDVKKALATKLKVNEELVFVKQMQTMTGTHNTVGKATAYETIEQARFIEPEYIIKRNSSKEELKEEENE
jgi:small subunit ribosomal protein S24e